MNNRTDTEIWMHRIIVVLGLIVTMVVVGTVITVAVLNQPVPEILITLGIVAMAGLVRLLVLFLILR